MADRKGFVHLSPTDLESDSPALVCLNKAKDAGLTQRYTIQRALEWFLKSGALAKEIKEARK